MWVARWSMQDMQASDQGASDGNASGNSLPLSRFACSRILGAPCELSGFTPSRSSATTQVHKLRMRQLQELGFRQTRADAASNRGACDATNGVAARHTTPIVNNEFQKPPSRHAGLLPTQACIVVCKMLPRLQTLTTIGQQTWRVRV